MKVAVGDFIRDLERTGAYGTVTNADVYGDSGLTNHLVISYTMDIFESSDFWRSKAKKAGIENWNTHRYEIVREHCLDTSDMAIYYDAVTQ